jgi:hypothetical protein
MTSAAKINNPAAASTMLGRYDTQSPYWPKVDGR